jgi:hypothetical protein
MSDGSKRYWGTKTYTKEVPEKKLGEFKKQILF